MHTVLSKITFLAYKKKGKRKDCVEGNAYLLYHCLRIYVMSNIMMLWIRLSEMKNMQIEEIDQGGGGGNNIINSLRFLRSA